MGDLLVLWDVDGTLLDAGGVGSDLYGIVFSSMFGRRCEQLAPMAGRTDRAIILDTLEMAGIPEPRRHVDPFIEELRAHSPLVFQAAKQRSRALPGAADAIAAVASATVGASTIGFTVPGTALPSEAPASADSAPGEPQAEIPVSVIPAPERAGAGSSPVPPPMPSPVPVGGSPVPLGSIPVPGIPVGAPIPVNGVPGNGLPASGVPVNGVHGVPANGRTANGVPVNGVPVGPMQASPVPGGGPMDGLPAGGAPGFALVAAGTAPFGAPVTPARSASAGPAAPSSGRAVPFGRPRPGTPHGGAPPAAQAPHVTPVTIPVGRPRPRAGRVYQSVLTGNVRPLAEVKLTAVGLRYPLDLCIGAYGDDHEVRTELVHLARRRASGVHGTSGSDFGGLATVVVGDTPLDIEAALAAGARAVGVATGSHSAQDLRDAGAHAVLDDLTSIPAVLAALLA